MHGARLARQLLAHDPTLQLSGIGSDHMQAAGVDLLLTSDALSVIGLIEVISKLPNIYHAMRTVRAFLKTQKPDLVILIDYAGFNLRMAKAAKKAGIKTLYYIAPQIWAWRAYRMRSIKRWVDHVAVTFPFEKAFYEKANVPATFVGHPLADSVTVTKTLAELQKDFQIDPQHPTICLLPGSRTQEIQRLLPVMIDAIALLRKSQPHLQTLLAAASNIDTAMITPYLHKTPIKLIQKQTYQAIYAADLVITASGTATLETALLQRPMIIIYKTAALTFAIAKRLVKIPYVGLSNILAGEKLFPVLIQDKAKP
jgi:lipid-A-disaccharide synthase